MGSAIFNWNTLWYLMVILYVPACIGLIVIVLLQKGKGSGFAGAFGVGPGSDTVFGPRGGKSMPVKLTHIMAALFMILAICMSLVAGKRQRGIAPDLVDEEASAAGISALEDLQDLGLSVVDEDGTPLESALDVTEPAETPDDPAEPAPGNTEDTPAPDEG